jgi:L-lactate dehydrogenase (cytochrome)
MVMLPKLTLVALSSTIDASLSWKDLDWVKKASGGLPILVKGIHTVEDAILAEQYGADGIFLSNHGGRQVNTFVQL